MAAQIAGEHAPICPPYLPLHPNFAEAVSLHRTIEAIVRSSSTGRWEAVV
jgi:predicted dehydrogenase